MPHINMIRIFVLTLASLLSYKVLAESKVTQVHARVCSQGVYEQPGGQFAIHVFCDDALGTNIAIFLNKMGAPVYHEYDLGSRFWQSEEWAYDVMSFSWLADGKLLLSTSAIYGSGSVYVLDPGKKQSEVLLKVDDALIELVSVEDHEVKIRYQTELNKYEYKTIGM